MRKTFITLALLLVLIPAMAQDDIYEVNNRKNQKENSVPSNVDIQLTSAGAYEIQKVVCVDSTSASVLYDRAMMTLTDLTGSDGKAKAGIDYQNQETHTVVYKGKFELPGVYVDCWADFTMKIRCKDGRAQLTVTVPMVEVNARSVQYGKSATIIELKQLTRQKNKKRRDRAIEWMRYIKKTAEGYMISMEDRLKGSDEEEF